VLFALNILLSRVILPAMKIKSKIDQRKKNKVAPGTIMDKTEAFSGKNNLGKNDPRSKNPRTKL
jgi:hypothetical protein